MQIIKKMTIIVNNIELENEFEEAFDSKLIN